MKTIGIMIGINQSEYVKSLMREFDNQAKELGVRLIFLSGYRPDTEYTDKEDEVEDARHGSEFSAIYDYAPRTGCEALIICYGPMSGIKGTRPLDEVLKRCKDIPSVLLEYRPSADSEYDVPYIIADNYSSTCDVVKHLIQDHEYNKIAFIAGPRGNYSSEVRLQAYKDVMAINNIEVTDDMIAYGDFTTKISSVVKKVLDNNPGIQAICCANDNMARACYTECANRGLSVGKDIAITGFDNSDISSRLKPSLTTVEHDSSSIAANALDMAIKLSNHESVVSIEQPADLLIRRSCGCNNKSAIDERNLSHNSNIFAHENIDNYDINVKELKDIAVSLAKENEDLSRRINDVSFFVREFIGSDIHTDYYFEELFSRLRDIGLSNAYFFVNKAPLVYEVHSNPDAKKHMYFAGGFNESTSTIIPIKEWHRHQISSKKGFNYYLPDDGKGNYHTYVLFSGEAQYGVMLSQADFRDNEFLLYVSLQLSNLLHIYNLKSREKAVVGEMERSIERVKESNQILSAISRYDELTKILNRRGFMEQALATIQRNKGREAIIMFGDLDHLKEINDCFGHGDGDFAINTAAKLLTGLMPRDGFVARIGGDEFVAFIPVPSDVNASEYIKTLKDNLKEAMFLFNLTCNKPYFVEISSGFTSFICEEDMDLAKLIANSDEVLYEDKSNRRASIKKA